MSEKSRPARNVGRPQWFADYTETPESSSDDMNDGATGSSNGATTPIGTASSTLQDDLRLLKTATSAFNRSTVESTQTSHVRFMQQMEPDTLTVAGAMRTATGILNSGESNLLDLDAGNVVNSRAGIPQERQREQEEERQREQLRQEHWNNQQLATQQQQQQQQQQQELRRQQQQQWYGQQHATHRQIPTAGVGVNFLEVLLEQMKAPEAFSRNEFRKLNKRLDKLMDLVEQEMSTEFPLKPDCIPLATRDEVEDFEHIQEDEYKQTVRYLGALGGSNINETANEVFKKAVDDSVSPSLTWQGREPGTVQLGKGRLAKALFAAVAKNRTYPTPTWAQFSDAMTAALKCAKQRNRTARQRQQQQQQQQQQEQAPAGNPRRHSSVHSVDQGCQGNGRRRQPNENNGRHEQGRRGNNDVRFGVDNTDELSNSE